MPFETLRDWECFGADTGKDSARDSRVPHSRLQQLERSQFLSGSVPELALRLRAEVKTCLTRLHTHSHPEKDNRFRQPRRYWKRDDGDQKVRNLSLAHLSQVARRAASRSWSMQNLFGHFADPNRECMAAQAAERTNASGDRAPQITEPPSVSLYDGRAGSTSKPST